MSGLGTCPACGQPQVRPRYTWRAILYAIFCFPCGLFCCLRRKTFYCTRCNCDIVEKPREPNANTHLGYNYRLYEATKTGLPPNYSAYRNEALSVSSTVSEQSTTSTSPIID